MVNLEIDPDVGISDQSKLSVLFICYARIEQVIASVSSLANEGIVEFYVSIDGPKNKRISKIQFALIEALKVQAENLNVMIHIQQSDCNLGLSKAVQFGVDWVFQHAESAIILEDDLKISANLAQYFSVVLRKLENVDKALIASANQFHESQASSFTCTWTTYPLIWGWATTRSKWKEIKDLINTKEVRRKAEKSFAVRGYWHSGRIRVRAGIMDSWALPLADAFHHGAYLAICPPVNLCTNVGDDEFGVHTSEASNWMSTPAFELNAEWEIPELDLNRLADYDHFLEKEFFRIRFRHIFSPAKAKLHFLLLRLLRPLGSK